MNAGRGCILAGVVLLVAAGAVVAQETVTPEQMKQAMEQLSQMGQGGGEPTDYNEYRKSAPKSLLGLALSDSSGQNQKVMNMASSSLTLEYGTGDKRIEVTFNDTGTMAALAAARMAFSFNVQIENDEGFTRSADVDGHKAIHTWENDSGQSRTAMGLGDRGMLEIKAWGMGQDAAVKAAKELPLSDWSTKASK